MTENMSSQTSTFTIDESNDEKTMLVKKTSKKLTWGVACLFVLGEIIGGGAVAMPDALANIGWPGIILIGYLCFANIFAAIIQCRCLDQASKNDADFNARSPYSTMVQYAFGKTGRIIGSVSLDIMTVLVSTVYLLMSSELTMKLLTELFPHLKISVRVWMLIFTCFLVPLTFFGTPKDFWGVALSAVLCTAIGISCIMITCYLHIPRMRKEVPHRAVTVQTFFTGVGTFFFAFNVLALLPNIYVDMENKQKFNKTIYVSFGVACVVYLILSVTGFVIVGGDLKPNIIYNMLEFSKTNDGPIGYVQKTLTYISLITYIGHFIFAYVLVFNNVAQDAEELFQIPRGLCWQRCIIRSSLVLLTLLIGESVPQFEIVLSFTGGFVLVVSVYTVVAVYWKTMFSAISLLTKFTSLLIVVSIGVAFIGTLFATIIHLVLLYSKKNV